MNGTLNLILPEDIDAADPAVASMIESINDQIASLPEDAKIIHLRLLDDIEFTDAVRNRLSWYLTQIRKSFSVIDPKAFIICNQFDLESEDIDFDSFEFEIPDSIDGETYAAIMLNLTNALYQEESVIDTSASEILLI